MRALPSSSERIFVIRSSLVYLSVFAFLFSSLTLAEQPQDQPAAHDGIIRQVTLYRDQARVTREINVPPADGVRVIEVTQLPVQVVSESVFAEGNEVTSVRAVRVSSRPVVQPNPDQVRPLQQQLDKLQQQRAELQHSLELTQANLKSLEQMINFSAAAAKSDLDRGVLNAETVSQLTDFSMDKRCELSREQFQIEGQIAELDRRMTATQAKISQMVRQLREQQRSVEIQQGRFSPTNPERRDLALNSLAGQMQQIELRAEATSWRSLAQDAKDDIASQSYTLAQPVRLATLRQQQLVQILDTELKGEMYHVATPLLSTFAYREVQMTNKGIGLLSGPASVYLDDRFVGRTQLPSTASGQLLTIGLGADPQVRTRRELLDKQDEVQGGNRRLRFVYRLVLANFKDRPISIRLMDRMPITRQTRQLSISLEDPELELSDDGLYQRVERPTGLLRWDLTVPEGRFGSKAFDVQYSYTAEFDRNRVLDAGNILQEMQADYKPFTHGGGMGGMGGFGGGMGGMQ